MKLKILLLGLLNIAAVNVFAFRDSYEISDNALTTVGALICLAVAVIALVVGFFRNLFK